MAAIGIVNLSNEINFWRLRTNEVTVRLNAFAVNESMLYANTLIANNVFKSFGNTVLGGTNKRTIVNGTFTANGVITLGTTGTHSVTLAGKLNGINSQFSGNSVFGGSGKKTIVNGVFEANGSSVIKKPRINGYSEDTDVRTTFTSTNLKLDEFNNFVITVTRPVTLRLINPGTTGAVSAQVKVIQANGGGHAVTFTGYNSSNVLGKMEWPGNTVPSFTTTVGKADIFSFSTINGNGKYDSVLVVPNLFA